MNILTDELPHGINIDNCLFPIETDFRSWLKISELLENFQEQESIIEALKLCYKKLPPSLDSAVLELIKFYIRYKEKEKTSTIDSLSLPLYSFKHDADYIYPAFMEQYSIDLSKEKMHWFLFMSLFEGLHNCKFTDIVGYRSINLNTVKDKEQKKFYKKMKQIYKLPDLRSEAQKEADMLRSLEKFF